MQFIGILLNPSQLHFTVLLSQFTRHVSISASATIVLTDKLALCAKWPAKSSVHNWLPG